MFAEGEAITQQGQNPFFFLFFFINQRQKQTIGYVFGSPWWRHIQKMLLLSVQPVLLWVTPI